MRQKRFKTVELIETETDWIPDEIISKEKWVLLRIGYHEENLRERIKTVGGYWEPENKTWRVHYGKVLELKLANRIIDPPVP